MNELSELRGLRADTPPSGADRLVSPRARLTAAIHRDTSRGRAGLPQRRMILVGAATAGALAVTAGIITALPGDGTGASAPKGPQVLSAGAAADTLELAAATVEKHDGTEPGPKQWVYEKETAFDQGGRQHISDKGIVSSQDKSRTSEEWTRWDGTGHANLPGIPPAGDVSDFDPDKLQVWYGPNQEEKWKREGYDDRSQRQFYRFLDTLPSDPDRMMKRIREEHAIGDIKGETRAQRDWREINVLYRSVLIPPKVQAGLFRALAKIPGARVTTGVKDPLGRAAISVSVNYPEKIPSGWQGKQEIFFDPESYAYLGDSKDDGLIVSARDAWGVVDKPGARP
ncbi:CU044_5270 family protein [Streptomyces dubilierae]|uniref:CU044_5270 family protein n=1 Tax=Streptomyces dubilierae TaxID=3075533 RepID=A0ABU2P546_9ACTN|nr:CU044_5270 family protein [Streptomyces sp. DSM 41921]MDT0386189.1 CU044_5270 family protein [Streptomyces sp. DSM 41921]